MLLLQTWMNSPKLWHLTSVFVRTCVLIKKFCMHNNNKPWFTAKLCQAKKESYRSWETGFQATTQHHCEKACRISQTIGHTAGNHQQTGDLNVFYCKFDKPKFTLLTCSPISSLLLCVVKCHCVFWHVIVFWPSGLYIITHSMYIHSIFIFLWTIVLFTTYLNTWIVCRHFIYVVCHWCFSYTFIFTLIFHKFVYIIVLSCLCFTSVQLCGPCSCCYVCLSLCKYIERNDPHFIVVTY